MQVFDRDGRINFVDANNVVLGYSLLQDCCENAEWRVHGEGMETSMDAATATTALVGYKFDPAFFEEGDHGIGGYYEDGGVVTFRAVKDGAPDRFVTISNSHNGYYGHGFDFSINGATVRDGTL